MGGGGGGVNDGAGTEVWRILAPSRRSRTDDKKKKEARTHVELNLLDVELQVD